MAREFQEGMGVAIAEVVKAGKGAPVTALSALKLPKAPDLLAKEIANFIDNPDLPNVSVKKYQGGDVQVMIQPTSAMLASDANDKLSQLKARLEANGFKVEFEPSVKDRRGNDDFAVLTIYAGNA